MTALRRRGCSTRPCRVGSTPWRRLQTGSAPSPARTRQSGLTSARDDGHLLRFGQRLDESAEEVPCPLQRRLAVLRRVFLVLVTQRRLHPLLVRDRLRPLPVLVRPLAFDRLDDAKLDFRDRNAFAAESVARDFEPALRVEGDGGVGGGGGDDGGEAEVLEGWVVGKRELFRLGCADVGGEDFVVALLVEVVTFVLLNDDALDPFDCREKRLSEEPSRETRGAHHFVHRCDLAQ